MPEAPAKPKPAETRQRLLDATRSLMLQRGFTGTGVEQICVAAGVTKGAFFHHFPTKEALGEAALADWAHFGMNLYAAAAAEPLTHPLAQVHKFIAIMEGFVRDTPTAVTCLVGMLSQEMSLANPTLRAACHGYLGDWAHFAQQLLETAQAELPPARPFDAAEVAWLLQCIWQGGMLISKTRGEPEILLASLRQAREYVDSLFYGPAEPPTLRRSAGRARLS